MAKALVGHLGGPDPRTVEEMRRLKQRVRDLEAELAQLRAANDALQLAAREQDEMMTGQAVREPALT